MWFSDETKQIKNVILSIGHSCYIAIYRFLSRYCFKYMRWRFYGCSVFINDFHAYPLRKAKRNKTLLI